ncbi:hypothetical protein BX616_007607 [Lobosporangium transversale]|nr:hypothetical protein BX616_007607 [Lobosporangium transversale]
MSSHPWTKTYLQCHHQQQPQAFNLYPQSYCTQHYPQYYSSEELSEAIQNGQHFHHHSSPQAAFKGEKEYHFTPVLSTLKRRRRLTNEESEFLIHQFKINERPTAQERESFAKYLKLDRRTIQVWFQNRRAKLKRDEKGGEESAGEDQ